MATIDCGLFLCVVGFVYFSIWKAGSLHDYPANTFHYPNTDDDPAAYYHAYADDNADSVHYAHSLHHTNTDDHGNSRTAALL